MHADVVRRARADKAAEVGEGAGVGGELLDPEAADDLKRVDGLAPARQPPERHVGAEHDPVLGPHGCAVGRSDDGAVAGAGAEERGRPEDVGRTGEVEELAPVEDHEDDGALGCCHNLILMHFDRGGKAEILMFSATSRPEQEVHEKGF